MSCWGVKFWLEDCVCVSLGCQKLACKNSIGVGMLLEGILLNSVPDMGPLLRFIETPGKVIFYTNQSAPTNLGVSFHVTL